MRPADSAKARTFSFGRSRLAQSLIPDLDNRLLRRRLLSKGDRPAERVQRPPEGPDAVTHAPLARTELESPRKRIKKRT
jgi:hypothetical protein